ncbi:MAG TPA: hypothetical protein VHV80_06190, partial [Steroidobacteraceae bacterium]|nr:hypothetical protein [Steroidobacteraceae bacterium]
TVTISPAKPSDGAPQTKTFPAGSYVIRMDQPYSRAADALLDQQYWAPKDPQKHPYDDTGWSFPYLFNVPTVRVTDPSILKASMARVDDPGAPDGSVSGTGAVYAVNNDGGVSLLGMRYALKHAKVLLAEEPFDAAGTHFNAGSLIVEGVSAEALRSAIKDTNITAVALGAAPSVATRAAPLPRVAIMHTWLSTQTEGWWRMAFDKLHVPYAYINTQTAAREADLRAKYDVIVFAPAGNADPQQIVDGMPMYGNPMPWEKTALTPNLGLNDSTADIRPELGFDGLEHLQRFIEQGGLLITSEDTAQLAVEEGFAPGVFMNPSGATRVVGSVLGAEFVDRSSPVAYGYGPSVAVYSASGMAFTVSDATSGRPPMTEDKYDRPTGRGGPRAEDVPEGRPFVQPEPLPAPKPWQATPLNSDQARNNPALIPVEDRPDVILRFVAAKQLLLSGLLENPGPIAQKAIVVDAHYGHGNVLLFANNPVYRAETISTYALVFNAILNYDHLGHAAAAAK